MLELPLHKSDSLCIASLPNQFPVNLVSADRTTTIDGLGLLTAFGLRYYDTEVVAAPSGTIEQGKQPFNQANSARQFIQMVTGNFSLKTLVNPAFA